MEAAPQLTGRMQAGSRAHPPPQPATSRTLTCNQFQSSRTQLYLHMTPRTMSTCLLMETVTRPSPTCHLNKIRYLSLPSQTSRNLETSSRSLEANSSLHSLANLQPCSL